MKLIEFLRWGSGVSSMQADAVAVAAAIVAANGGAVAAVVGVMRRMGGAAEQVLRRACTISGCG